MPVELIGEVEVDVVARRKGQSVAVAKRGGLAAGRQARRDATRWRRTNPLLA
jgi:hypothetical protein